ncbi:hypothetical protein PR202_gb28216 [Eleusine coracana subsp. coracana]|uniref:Plastocyanin-like domain-containing protein n=1 Tax=Eleusine coracana subsp. coracana TaxID=191504 RepID=A0AAV5FTS1_ELECO|nr:hypothetical protein PR202_gb28216 [Eleusine coracana subsp. coracana]
MSRMEGLPSSPASLCFLSSSSSPRCHRSSSWCGATTPTGSTPGTSPSATSTPLGVKQEGILINGQFPGPQIDAVTNDNIIVNVFNNLPVPFLLSCTAFLQHLQLEIDYSLNQARSIRWNLTASGPRPNPQGSYHYGLVNTTRTIRLANSRATVNGKLRYAVNSVSFIPADTPLKVADFYNIQGVFTLGSMPDNPSGGGAYLQTSVMAANMRELGPIGFIDSSG